MIDEYCGKKMGMVENGIKKLTLALVGFWRFIVGSPRLYSVIDQEKIFREGKE